MRWCAGLLLWSLFLIGCSEHAPDPVARTSAALGEPVDGFPTWFERVIHVFTNRARVDPEADLASCSVCGEKACYSPVPPLAWSHNLARAARFHSDNLYLGGCSLQHDSPCTLVSDIDILYDPGACDGSPSCACVPGTHQCGSSGTNTWARIGLFGSTGSAENIIRGRSDPVSAFYGWLHESDSDTSCGWRLANGHRANILGGSRSLGVGKSAGSTYVTADFGGGTTPPGVVDGVHYPATGPDVEFRATWNGTAPPTTAAVSVNGTCTPMTLERGTETMGTLLASVTGLMGCTRYFFHFTSGGVDLFYPTTGSFGIGCATDWEATRPAPCGPCDPDCSGMTCGGDGCGGSCGSCTGGLTCSSGSCVCAGTVCSGSCVDTDSDDGNCGACGIVCATGESCVGGQCRCAPDCVGRFCGDDGCGGSCGVCPSGRACNASGQCTCAVGEDCNGSCTDTSTDRRNCGGCGNRCRGNQFCVNGLCVRDCTPDCTGRMCGTDGCAGSCGTCPGVSTCDASGQCACPAGATDCGGTCVDTNVDVAHCGACENACAATEVCQSGACIPMCDPDCTGKRCGDDGCAGSCGSCGAGASCNGGACVCSTGLLDCGGACVDTTTDPSHCGACDVRCAVGETCAESSCTCVPSCAGRTCGGDGCGGSCGTCGVDRVCTGGQCACDAALTECGGTCVDVRVDEVHCGACGNPCAAGEECRAGICGAPGPDGGCTPACEGRACGGDTCGGSCGDCPALRICATGGACLCDDQRTACGDLCVDTRVDSAHCGGCSQACGAGAHCQDGHCDGALPLDGGTPGDGGLAGDDGGSVSDGGATDGGASGDAMKLDMKLDGTCACRTPGGSKPPPFSVLVGLSLLPFLRRRRR